ncbi:hypothetical protein ACSLNP_25430, partial [Escherichia coli]
PFPVQVRLRMPRQHNSSSRPYLRRATHSPRGFCIVSPAVHLPESFEIPWNPNTRTEVSTLCISQFRYSAQIRPSSVVTKDY